MTSLSCVNHPTVTGYAVYAGYIYSIPCECGMVYFGHTDCSIETNVKEHHCHRPEKLVFPEYSINLGHCILNHTSIVAKKSVSSKIIREAIEIELHLNSMNREDEFSLSRLWGLLLTP
jgi:hypothetical protein